MRNAEPFIELSVRVSDGSYESSLRIPVDSTKEQREGLAKTWVGMMAQLLSIPSEQQEERV